MEIFFFFFSRNHLWGQQRCQWQQPIIDHSDYLWHSFKCSIWSSLLNTVTAQPPPPTHTTQKYLMPFEGTNWFSGSESCSFCNVCGTPYLCGLRKSNKNHILFIKKYKNSPKRWWRCQQQRLIPGAAWVTDRLLVVTSCWGTEWAHEKTYMICWCEIL